MYHLLCISEHCLSTAKQLKLENLFAARIVLEKVLRHGRATVAQVVLEWFVIVSSRA